MEIRSHATRVIVVDSTTWADFFNGASGPQVRRLDAALQDEEFVVILPIILTEVLQGFRTEAGFHRARQVLEALPTIVAQVCLDLDALLVSSDVDFRRIALHAPLHVWRESPR